ASRAGDARLPLTERLPQRLRCRFRWRLRQRPHARNDPVTALGDRLDVGRPLRRIAERLAQLEDDLRQRIVADDEAGPRGLEQRFAADHVSRAIGEQHEHRHRLGLELHDRARVGYPVERGLDRPATDLPSLAARYARGRRARMPIRHRRRLDPRIPSPRYPIVRPILVASSGLLGGRCASVAMGAACAREWHAGRKAAARRPITRRILEPTGGMMKLHLIGMLAVLIPIAGSQPAAAADPAPPNLVVRALADKEVTELPPGPLFWRIDRFPARAQAEAAAGRFSLVAETGGQVWLFTLGPAGGSSAGGTKVAEIGPIAPISASRYLLRINEASGPPGAVTSVHSHPGSEAFYVL